MTSIDTEKLRKLKFSEFCDKWMDNLDPELDYAAEVWIELFRAQIFKQILDLRQKIEKIHAFLTHIESDAVYELLINELVKEKKLLDLPAYETLLPLLKAVNAEKDASFLEVIALLKTHNYDERTAGTTGNNQNTPSKNEKTNPQ